MINELKDEMIELTKTINDFNNTIKTACELFIEANKDKLSYRYYLETTLANKKLNDELKSTQNALNKTKLYNDYLQRYETVLKTEDKTIVSNKVLTDEDITKLSEPLDLHGLHLSDPYDVTNTFNQPNYLIATIPNLSRRVRKCLKSANIVTFKDLTDRTPQQLMRLKGFGTKCLNEVQALIKNNKVKGN